MADNDLEIFFKGLPIWGDLPIPPDLRSDRIKSILSLGLTKPTALTPSDVQELSASVVHHLVTFRCIEHLGLRQPIDL